MNNFKNIAWLLERIIHKYIQYEKIPQLYCDDLMLTTAEIHTIAIIGDNEGINITQLSKERGITKGAVSQMIYKLVDKGLVEKRISPDSDAAVSLFLTEKGKQAYDDHRHEHETRNTKFTSLLDSMPSETQESMTEFLMAFEKELDSIQKE